MVYEDLTEELWEDRSGKTKVIVEIVKEVWRIIAAITATLILAFIHKELKDHGIYHRAAALATVVNSTHGGRSPPPTYETTTAYEA